MKNLERGLSIVPSSRPPLTLENVYQRMSKVPRWFEFVQDDPGQESSQLDTTADHRERLLSTGVPLLLAENELRRVTGQEVLNENVTTFLLGNHEIPEILMGNQMWGLRTTADRQQEQRIRERLIKQLATDPQCAQTAHEAASVLDTPNARIEGRFLLAITALDHLGFALKTRQQALYGIDHRYNQPHLLVWDTLLNHVATLIQSCREFPSLITWLQANGRALLTTIDEFHSNEILSEILIGQMHRHSPKRQYSPATELVARMGSLRRDLRELLKLETIEQDELGETAYEQELQELIARSVYSEAAHRMIRFSKQAVPGTVFPYEARLDDHSQGTYERAYLLVVGEQQLRLQNHLPPAALDIELFYFLATFHDMGELGLDEDPLHGNKSPEDRIKEEQRFKAWAATVKHPVLRIKLLIIREMIAYPERSPEGRLWKASEHLSFLEMARRLDTKQRGDAQTDEQFTAESGVFVKPSYADDGSAGETQLPEEVIFDLLVNSYDAIIAASGEFRVFGEYLKRHRHEFRRIVQERSLFDAEESERRFKQLCDLKKYSEHVIAQQRIKRAACTRDLPALLDRLDAMAKDQDPIAESDLHPLVDGTETVVS